MRENGLRGLPRDKSPRTTRPAAETSQPAELVERDFTATRVNELWVADITYVRNAAGWVYAVFVLDVFSRVIVGQQVATSLYSDLALDALQMATFSAESTTSVAMPLTCVDVVFGTHNVGSDVANSLRWSSPAGNRSSRAKIVV